VANSILSRRLSAGAAAIFGIVMGAPAFADLTAIGFQSPLERSAARANQATYRALIQAGCDDAATAAPTTGACSGSTFDVFRNVRELVHNANELNGSGATRFSLGLDQEGLGFALRWTAAEELAAQGRSATDFSAGQLNSLASRVSALRFGARGSRAIADNAARSDTLFASDAAPLGGGASADPDSIASRWGGFIDGSFGYGRKDDTTFAANNPGAENAFDFDGQEVSVGVDYRLSGRTAVGLLIGKSRRQIDFDSAVSVVDGTIDADGYSAIGYLLHERGGLYVSGSAGMQSIDFDLVRRITYPSLNPLIGSTDATAAGTTGSKALLASLALGYGWQRGAFALEPFVRVDYQKITLDPFTERRASGEEGFQLSYGEQDVNSTEGSVGFKAQYAFSNSLGVFVPYLRGEYRREFEDAPRDISAVYGGSSNLTALGSAADFTLATDAPDPDFALGTAGVALVLPRGFNAFIQYQQVFSLETFTDRAITGGFRLEF
jgi:outer membrane autotransporter protein